MNTRKLFSGYVWWLRLEALIKALVTGLVVSAVAGLLFLVGCHLIVAVNHLWYLWFGQTPWPVTQWATGYLAGLDILALLKDALLWGLLLAVPLYFVYRPSTRKAAARVDKEGQFERMSTMLALKDDDSYIATVQREDALKHLKEVKSTSLPFHISYKPFAALGALLVAICLAVVCPFWQYVSYAEPLPEEIVVESRIIADLIAQLRQTVAQAEVSEEVRAELNGIIDQLEATVDDYDTTLTKAAKIAETRVKINEIIQREMATTDIGAVMQENETLKDLGAAIESGDWETLHEAVEDMRDEMFTIPEEERADWFKSMAELLLQAIEGAGGVDEDQPDATLVALQNLAQQFQQAAGLYEEGADPGDAPMAMGGIGLSDAEEAITDAMDAQTQIQDALQPLVDALNAAQNSLFENEQEETGDSEGEETPEADEETPGDPEEPGDSEGGGEGGEPGDGETGGEPGGEGGEGGGSGEGAGGGDEDAEQEEEGIFDPTQNENFGGDDYELTDEDFERGEYGQNVIGGNVAYDDVYLDYYASALQNIARADIPDSLKDVIIQYFTSLD